MGLFLLEANYEENYSDLKTLKKYKSLHLTSIEFKGRQVAATVGRFNGEIKYIEKSSRYLKKLDLGAGAVGRRRFIDMKRWIIKQKKLTDISLVPYWFPEEREEDIQDWEESERSIKGVVPLIHLLHPKIRNFTLFGFVSEDIKDRLDFQMMNHLQQFTLKAAFRPNHCDGNPEEFKAIHLELVKKVLKSKTLKILTLYSDSNEYSSDFWKSFAKLIAVPLKNPLIIHAKTDLTSIFGYTRKWWKNTFASLPQNIKLNYAIHWSSYFLSLPKGLEVMGLEEDEPETDTDDSSIWLGDYAKNQTIALRSKFVNLNKTN